MAGDWLRRLRRGPRCATPRQKWRLYRRQKGKCAACRQPLGWPVQAHHRQPWARGGTTRLRNLVLLHPGCHADADAASQRQPVSALAA